MCVYTPFIYSSEINFFNVTNAFFTYIKKDEYIVSYYVYNFLRSCIFDRCNIRKRGLLYPESNSFSFL